MGCSNSSTSRRRDAATATTTAGGKRQQRVPKGVVVIAEEKSSSSSARKDQSGSSQRKNPLRVEVVGLDLLSDEESEEQEEGEGTTDSEFPYRSSQSASVEQQRSNGEESRRGATTLDTKTTPTATRRGSIGSLSFSASGGTETGTLTPVGIKPAAAAGFMLREDDDVTEQQLVVSSSATGKKNPHSGEGRIAADPAVAMHEPLPLVVLPTLPTTATQLPSLAGLAPAPTLGGRVVMNLDAPPHPMFTQHAGLPSSAFGFTSPTNSSPNLGGNENQQHRRFPSGGSAVSDLDDDNDNNNGCEVDEPSNPVWWQSNGQHHHQQQENSEQPQQLCSSHPDGGDGEDRNDEGVQDTKNVFPGPRRSAASKAKVVQEWQTSVACASPQDSF